MLKLKLIFLMLIILCASAYGADVVPSEESIKELMSVTEAHKMLDNMMGQFDTIMKSSMQQVFKGETLTTKQQKQVEEMQSKMVEMFKQEMSWEELEPIYIQIYRDSFTQQEVDGMLTFYASPSGLAVIKKMPIVVQNTMKEMQKRMGSFLPKLIKMEKESIEKMKAETE